MAEQRRRHWATPPAKKATILLLTLQLVGCAVDLTTKQISLMAVFCMATRAESDALEWTGGIIWLILAFSWLIGAAALRVTALRPIYWLLILAIPLSLIVQQSLLRSNFLYCDAP